MSIIITQIGNDQISGLWPVIGPFLLAGAAVDEDTDIDSEIYEVFAGRARLWVIGENDRCVGAFATRIVCDSDGRALDIYGLGGTGQMRWGKALCAAMDEYAKESDCPRIIFKGRKALLRTYPGTRIVAEDGPNRYHFERAPL